MFKPKKLLKVVSILMIIVGVLGLIGSVIGFVAAPKLADMASVQGVDSSAITAAYTPLNMVISLVSTLCCMMAGIFGVSGKSFRGLLITAGIYTLILIVNTVRTAIGGGYSWILVLNFILPALFWWGVYQSKE